MSSCECVWRNLGEGFVVGSWLLTGRGCEAGPFLKFSNDVARFGTSGFGGPGINGFRFAALVLVRVAF